LSAVVRREPQSPTAYYKEGVALEATLRAETDALRLSDRSPQGSLANDVRARVDLYDGMWRSSCPIGDFARRRLILRAPDELQRVGENEACGRECARLFITSCVRVHTPSVSDRQNQA
jgi:hypothetical protein